ncbi:MAG: Gfo/Idh/MocA family oxidoreductase [Kiritimatiellaeota bacterium]|nr:Gfo/Idh/MocA family oxidoreductase [Kiritimatiellota bacterium]
MDKYRTMVVGMGKRGKHHAFGFHANDRFEMVGICDIVPDALPELAAQLGGAAFGTDAVALAEELKPDVFCFCTHPNIRYEMIELGVKVGARLIAFEKPLAMTSREAVRIKNLLDGSGVKAVVSHQHRYGAHYRKVKEIVRSGELGRIHTVYGTTPGWMLHMCTHLIDYMRWYAGDMPAEWAMAQAAGQGKFDDNHPSPDYIAGVIQFRGGVRGYIECGAGAPDQPEVAKWWGKNRIGVQGTEGFAEVLTNGGWRAVTPRGVQRGEGAMNYDLDMPPYIQEMADWLDGRIETHQNCFDSAYAGFQIMAAMCRSVIEGGQVSLPLEDDGMDEIAELRKVVPEKPVILSFPESRDEFPYGVL